MEYVGEHLWPGKIGHALLLAGFVASLLASLAFAFSVQRRHSPEAEGWARIGRWAFRLHAVSVIAVMAIILYLMGSRYFEYNYVFAHVSDDLPMQYILSAFWEGQEGSFLLWMFWHVVLGLCVMRWVNAAWSRPVLSIMSAVQFFIGIMLLGLYIYVGDAPSKIGINPFVLLRDVQEGPIFSSATYLESVRAMANGLNPLLQNYWMTIHPPTLFLGFASVVVPFGFAIAGLWTGDHKGWLRPVLPWALFSAGILGLGILMGGAWAYVALSFGGYWAWDPVENMSLVPWLVLVAGIHTSLVALANGRAIRASYVFYLFSFVLIIYSTFLTRSGILGDSSVHAFTELGLEWQLVAFLSFFALLSVAVFFAKQKGVPSPEKEEHISSRDFWMFIGSMVLFFSAVLITFSTSIPVYNAIATYFNPDFQKIAPPTDPIAHYNKYQIWIAFLIGILSGVAQYLRYNAKGFDYFEKIKTPLLVSALAALGISAVAVYFKWIHAYSWQYAVLLWACLFSIFSNASYLFGTLRGNLRLAASVVSHFGFGLMIIGAMASGLNKFYVSNDTFMGKELLDEPEKNVLLFKGSPSVMSGYRVTYVRDTFSGPFTRHFDLNFQRLDKKGDPLETFDLHPYVLYDKKTGKLAASNPSTKHYLGRDIFSHIYLPPSEADPAAAQAAEDSLKYNTYEAFVGDTLQTDKLSVWVKGIDYHPEHPDYEARPKDLKIGLDLEVWRTGDTARWAARPLAVIRDNRIIRYHEQLNPISTRIKVADNIFDNIFYDENVLQYKAFTLKEGDTFTFNNVPMRFVGFDKEPKHPFYEKEPDDIAVGALVEAFPGTARSVRATPVYLIRENTPFNLKDELRDVGLHFRFTNIDPKEQTITLRVAYSKPKPLAVQLEVAENAFRTDYVVLEAIVFPGINLFWAGALMMLLGLFLGMALRLAKQKQRT
jgi:cytochrome c-type biogenesis protein CcmF